MMQGTPEWLAQRAGKITASNFCNVLMAADKAGYRNYATRLALERILGKSLESGYSNKAMEDGNEREPVARAMYEVRTGNLVEEVDFIEHPIMKYVGASPDGRIAPDGGYESKCPIAATHYDTLLRDTIPPEHVPQVQGGMFVTGAKWWDFVSYHPDFPEALQLKIIRVHRDEEYINKLKLACIAFNTHVETMVAKLREMEAAHV